MALTPATPGPVSGVADAPSLSPRRHVRQARPDTAPPTAPARTFGDLSVAESAVAESAPSTAMTAEIATVAESIRRELSFSGSRREREAIANVDRGIRDALALHTDVYSSCGLDPLGDAPRRPGR